MSKNKKFILIILSIFIVLSLFLGISYAYYIKSHSQENSNIVKTKCLNFSLTNEKNDINLDEQYPIPDSEGRKLTPYQFTITNTCEQFISYNVNLESLETTTMDSSAVKVMINNEAPVNLGTLESTSVSIDSSKDSKILATGSLGSGDSVDYALRVWMDYGDSADTSSMNKLFESKIVVTATVGTYKPSDYVSTLHDAILVNEYGVTDVDNAISKIEAKGTPDFTNPAPIITWQEKKNSNVSNIKVEMPHEDVLNSTTYKVSNLNAKMFLLNIATSYKFNSSNGSYSLVNPEYLDPTKLDYSKENYYYCYSGFDITTSNNITINQYSECSTMYKIVGATDSEGTAEYHDDFKTRIFNLSVNVYDYEQLESDKSDKGMYEIQDDYGTSYYYRGNVSNNNIYFANLYWKIIRINGNGSIRLLYNGTSSNTDKKYVSYVTYNNGQNNPAYIGYMYGDELNVSYEKTNANVVESNAKKELDNWYENNIVSNNFDRYIADSGFCNDRSLASVESYPSNGNGYLLEDNDIRYAGYERYFIKGAPLVSCPNKDNDLFTTSLSNIGNKALKYPVGLITMDELMLSGLANGYKNDFTYTSSPNNYITISPSVISSHYKYAYSFSYDSTNRALNHWTPVFLNNYLRPVINLKANVEITGGIGTINDPYVIKTN